jgi:hypothetical protein
MSIFIQAASPKSNLGPADAETAEKTTNMSKAVAASNVFLPIFSPPFLLLLQIQF